MTTIPLPSNALVCNKLVKEYSIKKGAELGVRRGEFTASLLQQNSSLTMISVDVWSEHPSLDEKNQPHESNYSSFCKYIQGMEDRVIAHKMLTTEACNLIEDNSLDFIFFDATHTYDCLKQDILSWKNKLKPDGFFCGHDYHSFFDDGGMIRCIEELMNIKVKLPSSGAPYKWDENTQSVISALSNENGGVVDLTTTCWYCKKEFSNI